MSPNLEYPQIVVYGEVLAYCAEEITRQHDTPLAVYWMCQAWVQAQQDFARLVPAPGLEHTIIVPDLIVSWGSLAQPEKNRRGFRRIDIEVGYKPCPSWERVPYLMSQFCQALRDGLFIPSEAYREFEEIHPFRDGNGRVGKILYNFLLGTLNTPQWPRNFWGVSNA